MHQSIPPVPISAHGNLIHVVELANEKKRILYSTNAERTSFIMLRFVNLNEV